jgi:23S rRNA (cytosine1962-C5)-methyltransferase
MTYPQLKIKKGKEKSLYRFHPWIFSGAVEKQPEMSDNCIVEVVDFTNAIIGYGFVETKSQIVCRVFEFTKTPIELSEKFWKSKILSSFHLRKNTLLLGDTDCFRLIHAEGDYFPGLIIDIYHNVAVVQFRTTGTWLLKDIIFSTLQSLGYIHVFSKSPAYLDWAQGWLGEAGEPTVTVKENGLKFSVDVVKGQKTGFFLDQRENRKLLGEYAKDKKVLNCFSYTGGFSMYALAGGAKSVTSVDISKDAIENSKLNASLNSLEANHEGIAADCFEYLRKAEKDFDLIILDPPAFCKDIRSVPQASRGYKDINMSAMKMIKSGGVIFTFSCSQHISRDLFQKIVFGAANDSGRKVRILHNLSQGPDHPINIYHPEGDYLKGLVLEVI